MKSHLFFKKFNYLVFLIFQLAIFTVSCTKDPINNPHNNIFDSLVSARTIIDTAYGNDAKQKMDIYLPAGRNKTTKVIILIHGGAWQSGDKADLNGYKNTIQAKWPEAAVVNINYRLANNTLNIHYNEMMNDISAAVNFLANNKTNFAISDTFAMIGASAGAHLALLYTYKYNANNYVKCVSDFFGPTRLSDWDWYNSYNIWLGSSIKDILTLYLNSPWDQTLYDANSPYVVATEQSKPTIIFHGTIDVIVPIYQSQWLNARLNDLGVIHEYYEYTLDGHGFNASNTDDALTKTIAFFKKHIK